MLKNCAAIYNEKAPKSFSGYFGELVVFVFTAKGDKNMAKKRANGEGSIRKRSDGRWEGRYTVGYDENGKVKMKNVLGKTQAEVKEKLKEKIEEAKVLDVSKSESYTVAEWAALWFEVYAKPNIRERTADYYNRYITKHIVPCLGDIKLNKLTGRQIQKMYNDLLDHGRERVSQKEKNPGLSGTYVHGVHVMLHNCLNRAVKERLLVRNPADDVIVPKIDKKEMKILPPEQVKAYLKAASVRGVLPLFYLELTSGLRKGEIAALLWSDLDVENCTLSVTKQLMSSRDGELKITQPKTATSVRLISLPQETVELLKEEHSKHPLNIYMFPSPRTGGMYHPDSIVKLHEKILNDAGIEHLRFHDLRHPYVKHTTKIFSLRLMDFQAQAYPDARRKTRGACQLHRGGQSQSPVRPLCNRKQLSCLLPQSKMSWILYAISMRLSGYTSTRSISSSASSVVSASASKIALDASFRLSCRACSSCFCFACANTAA